MIPAETIWAVMEGAVPDTEFDLQFANVSGLRHLLEIGDGQGRRPMIALSATDRERIRACLSLGRWTSGDDRVIRVRTTANFDLISFTTLLRPHLASVTPVDHHVPAYA